MQTVSTDLVITGAHTSAPAVFWKGQLVKNVAGLKVVGGVVTLRISEDPILAEMVANGIKIVRA
jgi:hypothetical protein